MADDRIDLILEKHRHRVRENGIYRRPEYGNSSRLESLTEAEFERLLKEIKRDLKSSNGAIVRKRNVPVIWRYPEEMAASQPYYAVLSISGDQIPIIIKASHASAHPLPDMHPTDEYTGTSLLRVIGAPYYGVIQGKNYGYLRFVPGPRLIDLDLDNMDTDDLKFIFYDLGRACAEAHVIGLIDRKQNTIITTSDGDSFIDSVARKARRIINIDTASALYENALRRSPAKDTGMIIELLKYYQDLINYSGEDYLTRFFNGFRDGYVILRERFMEEKLLVIGRINELAQDLARPILARLNQTVSRIDGMCRLIEQNVRAVIKYKT